MNACGAIFPRTKAFESNSIWTSGGGVGWGGEESNTCQEINMKSATCWKLKGLWSSRNQNQCVAAAFPALSPSLSFSPEEENGLYGTSITAFIALPCL